MSQLHFYVPDDVEKRLRQRAEQADQPLSRYLADLVLREVERGEGWPEGYFEQVFGQWEGEPLSREPESDYEQRPRLN